MSIKKIAEKEGKMTLEFDNGDKEKFDEVMSKWQFKDDQSLLRFAISVMLLSEDNTITILSENQQKTLKPANNFIKDGQQH